MAEKVFKLSKRIAVHGVKGSEEIAELKLREPIADDVFDLEMPFQTVFSSSGATIEVKANGPALKSWIARLSGKSAGEFGAMSARDTRLIYQWLSRQLNVEGEDKDAEKTQTRHRGPMARMWNGPACTHANPA